MPWAGVMAKHDGYLLVGRWTLREEIILFVQFWSWFDCIWKCFDTDIDRLSFSFGSWFIASSSLGSNFLFKDINRCWIWINFGSADLFFLVLLILFLLLGHWPLWSNQELPISSLTLWLKPTHLRRWSGIDWLPSMLSSSSLRRRRSFFSQSWKHPWSFISFMNDRIFCFMKTLFVQSLP